jgi:outer membrane protein assembly factor BamB
VYALPKGLLSGDNTSTAVAPGRELYLVGSNGVVKLNLDRLGEIGADPLIWISKGSGAAYASPVVTNDCIFVAGEDGVLSVRAANRGDVIWETILEGGEIYSSPVADADAVLICNINGICAVVSMKHPHNVARVFDIRGDVLASPAIHDGILYLRTRTSLQAWVSVDENR